MSHIDHKGLPMLSSSRVMGTVFHDDPFPDIFGIVAMKDRLSSDVGSILHNEYTEKNWSVRFYAKEI